MGQFSNRQIVNSQGANNMTGTATVVSDWVDTAKLGGQMSLEIQITGTPNGTLTLEGTNRLNPAKPNDVDPTAVAVPFAAGAINPALPAVAGAAVAYLGGVLVLGNQGSARWIRLRYVNSSSTGQLNAWAHAAEL
jgi:hypothetical protein